ncbi:hypothetical protein H4R20_001795 [Coemansia guatemalensis]|uniref:Hepatocellular carcinoma-associated antigen 59-domain-containing protein n=1 Tax=Coemansia guatemalensis TaxID=2761395 RepID=A0A9W8LVB5_9FUNG|nr:hypothetical protein H4R20_001795 [Coemansia guatemalensis]
MPPKRPRNLRKTKHSDSDWDQAADRATPATAKATAPADVNSSADQPNTAAEDSAELSVDLADLLEFQKMRRRKDHGVSVDMLAKGERKKRQAKKHDAADTTRGEAGKEEEDGGGNDGADASKGGLRTVARSLDGAFTAQTNKLDANKHMMAYIETEMKRHRQGPGSSDKDGDNADGHAAVSGGLRDDDLYQVPKHLQVVDEQPVSEGNVAMAAKMLTSIQEVSLGAESRARNIRATDRALARPLDASDPSSLPTLPQQPHQYQQEGLRYRRHNNPSDRSAKATDDAALQRFKKRMRR